MEKKSQNDWFVFLVLKVILRVKKYIDAA